MTILVSYQAVPLTFYNKITHMVVLISCGRQSASFESERRSHSHKESSACENSKEQKIILVETTISSK